MFNRKKKPILKYKVEGEVVFADSIELNKVTGQTILYMENKIIFVVPKEILVQQTHDQSSCALSAQVLNYDIRDNLNALRKKENRTETDEFLMKFLYKMDEYLKYVSGDLYQNYHPKKIETINR